MYGYDSVRLRSSVVGSGEVVPSVMLSPNATKRTDDNTGTAETMTENPHAPDLPRLSVAVQVTRVVPRGKGVPDAGAHVVETGGTPPVGTGTSNVTTGGCPERASACTSAGHVTAGGGTGGSGFVGDPPHPCRSVATNIQGRWRRAAVVMNRSNTSGCATVPCRPAGRRGEE